MNRREFARTLAGAALSAAALPGGAAAAETGAQTSAKGIPFKLSVMLWTVYRDLPFEQRLEKVAEAGYQAVELVDEYKSWSTEEFRRVSLKVRSLNIVFDTIAQVKSGIADPGGREAFLSDMNTLLPIAEKLECPAIIVLSGNRVEGLSHDAQHQSCVETLKRAVDIAAKRNVSLLLENIDPEENPKYYLTSVAEGFEIVREVDHPRVKFLYDFYHEQISEGNLIKKLEKNIEEVGLVHIADVPGRHEPGTGEINYPNIFRKLAQLKYDRYAAMEFIPTGDAVASLRAAKDMALQAVSNYDQSRVP
ncbi:MAG: hydroxypyruvate isomerase [Acidobacteria bacterium]|nr:MAG: hydroxypyruvate isomerase [Acidobacteriota bacterium]